MLRRRAKQLIRLNAELERREAREREEAAAALEGRRPAADDEPDVVIGIPQEPRAGAQPKLLQAVMQALPEKSAAARLLTHGSKRVKKDKAQKAAEVAAANAAAAAAAVDEPSDTVVTVLDEHKDKDGAEALLSMSLLEAIQDELKDNDEDQCINLTDAEKAMMARKKM